jgi:hypothetical protein
MKANPKIVVLDKAPSTPWGSMSSGGTRLCTVTPHNKHVQHDTLQSSLHKHYFYAPWAFWRWPLGEPPWGPRSGPTGRETTCWVTPSPRHHQSMFGIVPHMGRYSDIQTMGRKEVSPIRQVPKTAPPFLYFQHWHRDLLVLPQLRALIPVV